MPDLAENAVREVHELHAFFVAWFRRDTAAATDFARCERALAPDFRMVAPEGNVYERAPIMARLKEMRGRDEKNFAINILQPRVVWRKDDAVLLEYIEQQYREGEETKRRSTVLFTGDPSAPLGVVWRHLHETWTSEGG